MSLIEQAARRLEELRRAAASPSSNGSGRSADQGAVPTPEAFVRAIDAAGESASDGARPFVPHVPRRGAVERAANSRTVDIDTEGLKARGFVTPDLPASPLADEFRVIKRPIIKNASNRVGGRIRNGNLVMVTSALPSEGKTFTAVNLAISIAMEFDNTVLLVDGDVAHPALPRVLGVPDSPGLLDLLTDSKLDISEALVRTNIEKLSVLPAGTSHRRATELLASEQMVALLSELAGRYQDRIVVFDSPPLLVTTEARVLATHMGQIVMVVAAESTSQNAVSQALGTIESCEHVMMMLNKSSRTDVSEYGYYYPRSRSR